MPEPSDRKELPRDTATTSDGARDEEAVRRLARHFLATPPQPKKAAPKGEPKPKGRRGKPQGR